LLAEQGAGGSSPSRRTGKTALFVREGCFCWGSTAKVQQSAGRSLKTIAARSLSIDYGTIGMAYDNNRVHHTMPSALASRAKLQSDLFDWSERSRRSFPWRTRDDPYAILVAEKLLQQTAAGDVLARIYEQFLNRYPTPQHLATADPVALEVLLQPLGFHYRARELIALGTALIERHRGQVPRDLASLLALPGVGDYIARAVLSFAYHQSIPIVDTNIARWLYRMMGIPGKLPSNPARSRSLHEIAAQLLPSGRSKEFNLAVLDLCALVCRPRVPRCDVCPVRPYCATGSKRPRRLGIRKAILRR
jgi:adenine-specific DNA glycosylase